tara:strand:- start:3943 stop:5208 length:1266 start_codon:yes stop_codon:yes gene_type:complete
MQETEVSVAVAKTSIINAKNSELIDLSSVSESVGNRITLDNTEINRVLGGGLTSDSVILITGEPGIGKSTMLLQIANDCSNYGPVLYLSGEESDRQIKSRATRLGISGDNLILSSNTYLEDFLKDIENYTPSLLVIDSIQTLESTTNNSPPGSVSQIRDCGLILMNWAKSANVPVIIAGHITKDGTVAGPRLLEHMVDVVLYLEGENLNDYRVLRSTKNRFGSTTEIGVLSMEISGLKPVEDPSKNLISNRLESTSGSCITPVIEGNRALMMEVQGLTSPTFSTSAPRRIASGIDFNRLLMLTTVLSKKTNISMLSQDVIVNVVGGFRINEPAVDCAILCALASSYRDVPLDPHLVVFGEIGLTGELRPVSNFARRIEEAKRLGFKKCIIPKSDQTLLDSDDEMDIIYAGDINEVLFNILG